MDFEFAMYSGKDFDVYNGYTKEDYLNQSVDNIFGHLVL